MKENVLGVRVDALTRAEAAQALMDAARRGVAFRASALAVHGVMCALDDPGLRHRLNRFDLVLPDGQPVRWALALLHGAALPDRVYGPSLTWDLCRAAEREGLPVAFFGSTREVLSRLEENLAAALPRLKIAALEPSRFRAVTEAEAEDVRRRLRASGARLVFCGLGCPRQEVWAWENSQGLGLPVVAVGAAFDFIAGTLRMAPPWMQRCGLEWLFRLSREPGRLWRRYLVLNPRYIWHLLLQAAGRTYHESGGEAPPREGWG